jgi:transcriptional antiterminator RfaH
MADGFWAVARTEPQRERTALHFLELTGYRVYLPRILKSHTAKGRTISRPTPLFPGYIFVLITLQWHVINNTIGVIRLIMDGSVPAHLPDRTIDEIKAREANGIVQLPRKSPRFRRGQKVHIMHGPFANHDGLYDGMAPHQREGVLLELLGRTTAIEVPKNHVVAWPRVVE